MRYLLDANTIIHLLTNQFPQLTSRVASCDEGSLATSAIAFAEVAIGTRVGRPPPAEALEGFLAEIIVLPFDAVAARAYATLPFRRGSYDRLIAGHALAVDLTLVTPNIGDFSGIAGLRVEDWTR